jgi:hypothetical protein
MTLFWPTEYPGRDAHQNSGKKCEITMQPVKRIDQINPNMNAGTAMIEPLNDEEYP